jgi:hypothetical protein
MPLKLERRECLISGGINTRIQKHGSENVTALDIPIQRVALSAEELCEVMLDKSAYRKLYKKIRGRLDEPTWSKIVGRIEIVGKVQGVSVNLHLGRKVLKMPDVTLKSLYLTRNPGGVTWLGFTIQCVPDLDENHPILEALFSKMGQAIDLALDCESYGAQPELPLEEEEEEGDAGEGEEEDDDGKDETMSGTGQAIQESGRRRGGRKDN